MLLPKLIEDKIKSYFPSSYCFILKNAISETIRVYDKNHIKKMVADMFTRVKEIIGDEESIDHIKYINYINNYTYKGGSNYSINIQTINYINFPYDKLKSSHMSNFRFIIKEPNRYSLYSVEMHIKKHYFNDFNKDTYYKLK